LRKRATAVIFKGGCVLLVRDIGHKSFSLPGGGIHRHEPVLSACVREIQEELSVEVVKIHRIPNADFRGSFSKHHACLVVYEGELQLRKSELSEFIWWNCKDDIPRYRHVDFIVRKSGCSVS
jgi:ADP-ribose pyrophosphatase YjhB (NUDIX family)